jgi:plastocyanin
MRKMQIALVLLLALGLMACSGKYKPADAANPGATGDTGPSGATGGVPADCVDQTGGDATITISGYAYDPTCLRVSASSSLTIVNEDPSAHSFSLEGGTVDETLDIGDTVKIKLADLAPGTYQFNCRFHPPMVGTLIVE